MVDNTFSWIFGGFFAFFVASSALSFYQMFHSPRCPPTAEADGNPCLRPLFTRGELVDVYLYLSTDPKIRWWTPEGLEELHRAPLWNTTALPYGTPVNPELVYMPLSLETLHGVRRNESMLYAHCFMVRGGLELVNAIRNADTVQHGKALRQRGLLSADVLHSRAKLTRHYPNLVRRRSNLLGNSTAQMDDDGDDSGSSNASSQNEMKPVVVTVPILGWKSQVYPKEALYWAGSVFFLSAFLRPSLPAAGARGGLAAVVLPWLVQLRGQQKEEQRRQLQHQAAQERLLWFEEARPVVPHLVPVVRMSLALDDEAYDARYYPPLLYKEMIFSQGMPQEREVRYAVLGRRYAPPLAIDQFGIHQRAWRPLDNNVSKPDPQVELELQIEGMIRYSVMQTIKESWKTYIHMGFQERDLEDMKDFLFRHPLHILILMQVIGFLQMTLTTLAFKNDVAFFRGRGDYSGLSSRSMATDTLQEIIIWLYLYDFDDISRIVLFQVGCSALIGAWKYAQVARLGIQWRYCLPWISHNRAECESSGEKTTEDIDARGMRYLTYFLYPLSAFWGIYNVYHYSYKSWWSWLVSSLADFAYTFGFINMMPQIFINYKLKSVAHMPWRVLMYKFFNTFIDDVFAFFIMSNYMTKKHRLMTLRDDIIFFIFLYQRYIYPVDKTRPDEFGFVYEEAPMSAPELNGGDSTQGARLQVAAALGDAPEEAGSRDAAKEGGQPPDAAAAADCTADPPSTQAVTADVAESILSNENGVPEHCGDAQALGCKQRRVPLANSKNEAS